MRKFIILMTVTCCILSTHVSTTFAEQEKFRRLSVKEYVDKMKAGWIGQMAGVGWGGPTEFRWKGQIIPEDKMPKWKPELVNQFGQDDIYVEMTFMRSLELYGFDVSIRQAGIDFANSGYALWHANRYGRENLRSGIAPPDSGHPKFNKHADDIDYQIEADFSGLIAPGLPNVAIKLGETFGRLMNYGDGLYGGQFVGGMYAEAFFENDMEKIIRAGLACIPKGSQYHECISDVLKWYHENPDDWQKTWQLIENKYQKNPNYRRFSCDKGGFNIDAKINGAYIVIGLLYGKGDPDKTIIISTRCGQDSDCNPSNAAGVLFTTIGFSKLPARFTSALDPKGKFSHTPYTFPKLVDVSKKLVRQALKRSGGRIEKDAAGQEVFVIPVKEPKPGRLEQCWEPGPIAGTNFTSEELPQLLWKGYSQLAIWLLLILAFFVLKENRNLRAYLILIPLVSVLVLWEISSRLIPPDLIDTVPTLVLCYAISTSVLFLLGEKLGKINRYISLAIAVVVFAVVGLFGAVISSNGFLDGAAIVFYTTYCFSFVAILLALSLTSLHCRKTYSKKRFLLLMLLYVMVLQIIIVSAGAGLKWGFALVIEYFWYIIPAVIFMGVVEYILLLPYWILAFNSKIYNQRFRNCLKLPGRDK